MKISKDATGLLSIDNTTYPAKASIHSFSVQDKKPKIKIQSLHTNHSVEAPFGDIAFSDPAVNGGTPYTKDTFELAIAEVKSYLL